MERLVTTAFTAGLVGAVALLAAACGGNGSSSASGSAPAFSSRQLASLPTTNWITAVAVVSLTAAGTGRGDALTFAPRGAASADPQVSTNWSGYAAVTPAGALDPAASPLTFTNVTASWRQPKVRCGTGRADAAAFWVGIGGFDTEATTLQQIGTTAQCSGRGVATYFAWWEIVPAAAVPLKLKVKPGDRLTAAVLVNGSKVSLSLKNLTRRTRFSKTVTATQALDTSSAEWIAEAPSECTAGGNCRVAPLTDFGSVTFSNAAASANGVSGTIAEPTWVATPVRLVTDAAAGGFGASPSVLSPDGRSFSVAWEQASALR
jgi:Peptidase A4 family